MKNKIKVTLEDVLDVTQKGFERVDGELKDIKETMATKTDINGIENILLRAQDNRVSKLEDDMRKVKTHLTLE